LYGFVLPKKQFVRHSFIHSFIVRVIPITQFHGRRMNGNKLGNCGQLWVSSFSGIQKVEHGCRRRAEDELWIYITVVGGGGEHHGWHSPCRPPGQNLNTRTRFITKPQKKERGFKAVYITFGPFFFFSSPETWLIA
jgi:hypothetical protein